MLTEKKIGVARVTSFRSLVMFTINCLGCWRNSNRLAIAEGLTPLPVSAFQLGSLKIELDFNILPFLFSPSVFPCTRLVC